MDRVDCPIHALWLKQPLAFRSLSERQFGRKKYAWLILLGGAEFDPEPLPSYSTT